MWKNNILLVFFGIFLIVNLSCTKKPSTKPRREPQGFNEIKWNQDLSTLDGLVCLKNRHPQQKICSKKDDTLKMDKVDLDSIDYYFWRDKFYRVLITIKGYENFEQLKKVVFKKFGNGIESQVRDGFGYTWVGEETRIDLGYLKDFNKGTLSIELSEPAHQAHQQIMNDLLKSLRK